jgi:hypothetical protein
MHALSRWWAVATALGVAVGSGASAAAASTAPVSPAAARPAVQVCGRGPAVVRPASVVLTCADDGELGVHLHWSSWTAARATASGIVTWRACTASCASGRRWDSTTADLTLTDPVRDPAGKLLFTRLTLHVTGHTPGGFLRNVAFDEAPSAAPRPSPRGSAHLPAAGRRAASGTLGYAQIEGFWIDAGGPSGSDGSYTYAQVAAAISGAESSFQPGVIQSGEPYSATGWGLWQITPGDELPANYGVTEFGSDYQVLDPWNNAESAVYLCQTDTAAGYNCFTPWSSYTDGKYRGYLQNTAADTELTDPGEYVQINSAPSGTPSSPPPDPGSTYGPRMPGTFVPNPPTVAVTSSGQADVFWIGTHAALWQADGAADGPLAGPFRLGFGPLGSWPAAGIDSAGDSYVYWEGTDKNLWEAYWTGSKWVGPVNRGFGPLGSPPTVAVSANGTAYVFWRGTGGALWEADGPGDGALKGPYRLGFGPLGSAPTAGVDSAGATFVYWEGTDGNLWEAFWNGKAWVGPYNRGFGPLG